MGKKPSNFKLRDATRAAKAAQAAGLKVRGIEIGKDGKIFVLTDEAPPKDVPNEAARMKPDSRAGGHP